VVGLNRQESEVKAVTFDLWETLLFEEDGSDLQRRTIRRNRLTQLLSRFGLSVSVEEVETALKETISALMKIWDMNKDVPHLDVIRIFFKYASRGRLSLKSEWLDELSKAYVSPLFEVPPYLNADAGEVLEWLMKEKKQVGIICNTGMTPGTELRRFLSQAGVAKYFRVMVFSNEVGVRKPDGKIFNLTARALKATPREIVHIGDNLKTDVWGAKSAGFWAVHLSGTKGRDKIAESDPESLVSLSRNLGSLPIGQIQPDKTITSLSMFKEAIKELETGMSSKR
jgi:putative hydrolase of the HAD superfamily